MKIGRYDVVDTGKALWKDFKDDDVPGLAAEFAYHALFSVVPLLIFLTALTGVVGRAIGVETVMNDITDWLFNQSGLPPAAAETLRAPIEQVLENQAGGVLSIGALLALWGAKNAVGALMKALNVVFEVPEGRPFWRKTLVSIGLTIALGLGIILVAAMLVLGGSLGEQIAGRAGWSEAWTAAWGWARLVLIPVLLALGLAVLYWAGPNVDAPIKWLTPGAVVAVVLWIVASFALGYYFQYAAGYVSTYGVLGAVMAFMFWLYVMGMILLLGAVINSVLLEATGEHAEVREPAKPGAAEAQARRLAAIGATPAPAATAANGTAPPSRFRRGLEAIGLAAAAGLVATALERRQQQVDEADPE